MSNERNIETQESLKREIKAIRGNCLRTCQVIENAPDASVQNPEDIIEKNNFYNRGLQEEIQNTSTQICTDDNFLTSQFLKELQEKTGQVEEMSAFTKGAINDVDAEINRLKHLITIANEAQSKPKLQAKEVQPEHVQKAKGKFQQMKNELHGMIQSLFPHCHDDMKELLGHLMSAKLSSSNGYIPITSENYQLLGVLKDMNIITTNPYNNMEVKITY